MEPLTAILRSLRLKSALLSRAVLTGRWGIHTRGASRPIFHGIVEGRALILRDGAPTALLLEAGDLVVLPRGDPHSLLSHEGVCTVPVTSLQPEHTGRGMVETVRYGSPGDTTRVVCGVFALDHPVAEGLIELLPEVMIARPGKGARLLWAKATLELLDEEVQREDAVGNVTSLADSLFVHSLSMVAGGNAGASSLLAAARDEQIGRALALIHGHPEQPWAAADLASKVGMSRSRFFERFTELVGEPPARYITRWRVHTAADLMRRQAFSVAEVAERVGYSSEDALSKVFKRHLGVSPSSYRRAQQDEAKAAARSLS